MDLRREQVLVETDRQRIEGFLTLPTEGYRSRLSDFLNARDREFLTLQDATVTPLEGGESAKPAVIMVARRHVRVVTPLEDQSE